MSDPRALFNMLVIALTALIITGYFVELLTFEFSALLLLALLAVDLPPKMDGAEDE